MPHKFLLAAAAAVLAANTAAASDVDRKDLQVFKDIADSVNRHTQFTIFDDVNAEGKSGQVTLTGRVTMPYKRDEIEKRVSKIDGVVKVDDRIARLPASRLAQDCRP